MAFVEVLMPRLSDTMSEGTVGRWLVGPGDPVKKGADLVEIETDKVTTVVEAEIDGVLFETRVDQGAAAPAGAVIAVIASGAEATRPMRPEVVETVSDEKPVIRSPGEAANEPPDELEGRATRVAASPLARRLAARSGVELTDLQPGSGPMGRILGQDVVHALERAGSDHGDVSVAPTRRQQLVAERMALSKREIPHYYLDAEVDVSEVLVLQRALRELERPVNASLTAFVVRAAAIALREVSEVNASWVENRIVRHSAVNIGIAVALDDGGLMVPVLRNADEKTLAEIASEAASLITRTREQKLEMRDASGATFTISNLGMYGVDTFHAVINPPESGILAVGAVGQRAAFINGTAVPREVMRISLSADHRVYSGQTGGRFLQAIRRQLENPLGLLA